MYDVYQVLPKLPLCLCSFGGGGGCQSQSGQGMGMREVGREDGWP